MGISIGELSRQAGVKVPTIRYYEQAGLLPVPERTEGQQRRYTATDVSRLNFIRHARELGFDVPAVRELLALSEQPDRPCSEVDRITRHHLAEVDRRIAQLSAMRDELQRMVDECGSGRVCECRVIEVLADHSECLHRDHKAD